ncbi:pectinesterase 1 [Fagus crenata]
MSLILGSPFGLLVHEYTTEPPESPSPNSADSIIIKAVCNLSIRVSIAELSNFKTIISNSNKAGAMVDCQSQIEDALSRLNDSVVAMEVGTGEKVLTESKIKDLQTWISLCSVQKSESPIWVPDLGPIPSHALSLRLSWLCHGRLVRERAAETRSLSLCFYFYF